MPEFPVANDNSGQGARRGRVPIRRLLALAALSLSLGGCGNCNGWTNPWYHATQPGSCQSDHAASEDAALLLPTE